MCGVPVAFDSATFKATGFGDDDVPLAWNTPTTRFTHSLVLETRRALPILSITSFFNNHHGSCVAVNFCSLGCGTEFGVSILSFLSRNVANVALFVLPQLGFRTQRAAADSLFR